MAKLSPTQFWPAEGTTTRLLLTDLLQGKTVTVISSLLDYNLMTPNARVSELRAAGWPIDSLKIPHPKLAGQEIVGYHMTAHFRDWWVKAQPEGLAPLDYTPQAGRGKFAKETRV